MDSTERSVRRSLDFNRAVNDPTNPIDFNPIYDAGDHLHRNDAVYQGMANSINPATLLR
jgi:hypothetical protein